MTFHYWKALLYDYRSLSGRPHSIVNVSRGSCTILNVSGESFKCILYMVLKQIRQNEKGKVRLKLV